MNQKLFELIATRESCNLKQREVAIRANISTRHYQYIEAGEREPGVGAAISIAEILGIDVEDIKKLFIPQATKAAFTDGQT